MVIAELLFLVFLFFGVFQMAFPVLEQFLVTNRHIQNSTDQDDIEKRSQLPMRVGLFQRIFATILRYHCENTQSANTSLSSWRSLPIEVSANINPFADVVRIQPLPANLETDYYPGESETICLGEYSVTLDILGETTQDIRNASNELCTFRQGGSVEHFLLVTPIWFIQAGHALFKSGQPELALRSWLNACRLEPPVGDMISPGMRFNIGTCLMEMGDFKNAGCEFLIGAERYLAEGKQRDAADCFERVVVCWESLGRTTRYRLGTENGISDSTECSRKAKYLNLSIGDYSAAARCSALEQDCHLRWQSRLSGIPRRIMRWMWLYGESPLYVLRSLLSLIVVVATAFFYFGFNRANDVVNYDFAFAVSQQSVVDFGDALYLAVVTISTLGYGDLSPASFLSKTFAGCASLSGIVLAAMFIVALQRRYAGR